jgi:hypothetical protein
MFKRLAIILVMLATLVITGCSSGSGGVTTATQSAGVDIIKQTIVSGKWTVIQARINLNSAIPILLKLAPGDTVDGYYFLEKGNNIDFQISGKSVIYQSTTQTAGSANVSSDRFSFTASDAQGIAYTLTFTPAEKDKTKKITPVVYLELIYPKTGEIFNPINTK